MDSYNTKMDLKPCPFCGGDAYIEVYAGITFINAHHTKRCAMHPDTWLLTNKSLKKQIKAWNMRASKKNNNLCHLGDPFVEGKYGFK